MTAENPASPKRNTWQKDAVRHALSSFTWC
jgi:hypothetical protein